MIPLPCTLKGDPDPLGAEPQFAEVGLYLCLQEHHRPDQCQHLTPMPTPMPTPTPVSLRTNEGTLTPVPVPEATATPQPGARRDPTPPPSAAHCLRGQPYPSSCAAHNPEEGTDAPFQSNLRRRNSHHHKEILHPLPEIPLPRREPTPPPDDPTPSPLPQREPGDGDSQQENGGDPGNRGGGR